MQGKGMKMEMYTGIIPYLCDMFNRSRRRCGFQRLGVGLGVGMDDLPEPALIQRKFRIAGTVIILLRKWKKEKETVVGHMSEDV